MLLNMQRHKPVTIIATELFEAKIGYAANYGKVVAKKSSLLFNSFITKIRCENYEF
jgi:hypothetical protein